MNIGERLRSIRESKKMSQGDVEQRTGLLRCYISRVENGHTVPSVETLEKIARAFDMKTYQILYDGNQPPPPPILSASKMNNGWGRHGKSSRYMRKMVKILPRLREDERRLLLYTAAKMANGKNANAAD